MHDIDLLAEANRQFAVCNACRYCEGFCAVFPAVELRTALSAGDLAYVANVCHDCRMCYDACMFTPPHEYGINIPPLLAAARTDVYERYAWPRTLAALFRMPAAATAAVAAIGFAAIFFAAVALAGVATMFGAYAGPGAFYRIFAFRALVIAPLLLTLLGALAAALGALAFWRDIGVRVRGLQPLTRAAHDALALTYMRGGGDGCYDARRGSATRRRLHGLVFWGFGAAFASTVSAGIEQDVFGIVPPFAYASVPVVLGVAGGLAIAAGTTGLLLLKRAADPAAASPRTAPLDVTFLVLLDLVALSGLAVLILRTTHAMGTLLAVHLALLAALYVTAPYGKFVHALYRCIALVKSAAERVQ